MSTLGNYSQLANHLKGMFSPSLRVHAKWPHLKTESELWSALQNQFHETPRWCTIAYNGQITSAVSIVSSMLESTEGRRHRRPSGLGPGLLLSLSKRHPLPSVRRPARLTRCAATMRPQDCLWMHDSRPRAAAKPPEILGHSPGVRREWKTVGIPANVPRSESGAASPATGRLPRPAARDSRDSLKCTPLSGATPLATESS